MAMTRPAVVELRPRTIAAVRGTVTPDSLRDFFDHAYGEVARTLESQGLRPDGPALAVWWGEATGTMDVACGFATTTSVATEASVRAITLPGGPAAEAVHIGAYDGLPETYELLREWVLEHDAEPGTVRWEVYDTRPSPDADPAMMRTRIIWPLAR